MKFPRVRDVLNKLKWATFDAAAFEPESSELDFAILTVADRVSGTKEISGSEIVRIGYREFDVRGADGTTTTIPHYKVTKIVSGDELIWKRPKEEPRER